MEIDKRLLKNQLDSLASRQQTYTFKEARLKLIRTTETGA